MNDPRSHPALDAARQWLKANPEPLKAWLDGVSTWTARADGLAALQASLKYPAYLFRRRGRAGLL
ncbi:hypothetical protein ACPA9J_25820 [Pseudomonas aeruginosa]